MSLLYGQGQSDNKITGLCSSRLRSGRLCKKPPWDKSRACSPHQVFCGASRWYFFPFLYWLPFVLIKDLSTARKLTLFCSIFGSVKKITQKLQTNYLSLNLRKYKAVIEANFSKGLAAVFHEKLCPHCQLIPDFTRCVLLAYLVSYERCICKSVFSCPAFIWRVVFFISFARRCTT